MSFPTIVEAAEVLPPGAPRPEWHRVRRQGIGGSDALAALGLSQYSSPYMLWLEKTGRLPPKPATGRMEWGNRLEPVVAEWFADETGLSVQRTGTWQRHDTPWALCNPDRLVSDGAGLEIKTVSDRSPDLPLWRDGIPDYPEAQAQWCMGVTGLERWWVAALPDGAERPFIRMAYRDTDLITELFAACGELWREYVLTDRPPPVDDSAATGDALSGAARAFIGPLAQREMGVELEGWLAERAKLKAQIDELTAQRDGIRNKIMAKLGDGGGEGLVDGVPRARLSRLSRTDADVALLRKDYPQVWEAVKRTSSYATLREVKPPAPGKSAGRGKKQGEGDAWNVAPDAAQYAERTAQ